MYTNPRFAIHHVKHPLFYKFTRGTFTAVELHVLFSHNDGALKYSLQQHRSYKPVSPINPTKADSDFNAVFTIVH